MRDLVVSKERGHERQFRLHGNLPALRRAHHPRDAADEQREHEPTGDHADDSEEPLRHRRGADVSVANRGHRRERPVHGRYVPRPHAVVLGGHPELRVYPRVLLPEPFLLAVAPPVLRGEEVEEAAEHVPEEKEQPDERRKVHPRQVMHEVVLVLFEQSLDPEEP